MSSANRTKSVAAVPDDVYARLGALREFQQQFHTPVHDIATESPGVALASLQDAVGQAPTDYQSYLSEALACYDGGQFRAAVLMVWAATIQHLYITASSHSGGVVALEAANKARFGSSKTYRRLRKVDDFLYLKESQFIVLGEDAGMYNRNARKLLEERLELRNRCGHPTRYVPGREEVVIFIESLLLNIIGGAQLNW